jgi:23S rRNA (uridine2552-2'-O)-methyltransferase
LLFLRPAVRETINSRGPYNLVMSDAAPATTGNRSVDTLRSLELAEMALAYGESVLVRGGSLVVKVFQGGGRGGNSETLKGTFQNCEKLQARSVQK